MAEKLPPPPTPTSVVESNSLTKGIIGDNQMNTKEMFV